MVLFFYFFCVDLVVIGRDFGCVGCGFEIIFWKLGVDFGYDVYGIFMRVFVDGNVCFRNIFRKFFFKV